MTTIRNIFILALFLFLPAGVIQAQSSPPHIRWNQLKDTIKDTIEINGYVFDVYICPPCPEGATCKPCLPNNITLVEKKFDDPQRVPLERRLRVYTEQPEAFKPGDHFTFIISRKGKVSFEYEAQLIGHRP